MCFRPQSGVKEGGEEGRGRGEEGSGIHRAGSLLKSRLQPICDEVRGRGDAFV